MTVWDDDALWQLPDWVGVGAVFKKNFGPNNRNTAVYHVLAIVDGDMVVKHWGKHKHRWFYSVECPLFITYDPDNIIEVQKKGTPS